MAPGVVQGTVGMQCGRWDSVRRRCWRGEMRSTAAVAAPPAVQLLPAVAADSCTWAAASCGSRLLCLDCLGTVPLALHLAVGLASTRCRLVAVLAFDGYDLFFHAGTSAIGMGNQQHLSQRRAFRLSSAIASSPRCVYALVHARTHVRTHLAHIPACCSASCWRLHPSLGSVRCALCGCGASRMLPARCRAAGGLRHEKLAGHTAVDALTNAVRNSSR